MKIRLGGRRLRAAIRYELGIDDFVVGLGRERLSLSQARELGLSFEADRREDIAILEMIRDREQAEA
jgi:hypothetical protein